MDFSGLGVLTDLLNWMVTNPWLGTSVLIATGPFVMVCATGWLFESRVVPLWHGQSLSFFPGELILCVTMGAIVFGMSEVTLEIVKDCYDQTYLLDRNNDKSYQLVHEGRAYTAIPSTYISTEMRQRILDEPLP